MANSKTSGKKKGSSKKPSSSKKRSSAKTAAKKNQRNKSVSTFSLLKPFAVFFIALGILFFILWVAWLDSQVRDKFEGKRWSVPAKVYARPLELFEGLQISPKDLQAELKRLQYRKLSDAAALVSGSYQVRGFNNDSAVFSIQSRGFQFPDGEQVPEFIELTIRDQFITSSSSALGRLEPQLIGGIYPAHNEDRVLIKLEQTPPFLIESLVIVEDKDFFQHMGVSPKGILRAAIVNFKSGSVKQGASTLTQQLVKNFFLTSELSLVRKVNEAMMAILLEAHYSKNDILQAYLNEVNLGQLGNTAIHGFGLGAQHYFGTELQNLELHQVALLVAIVNGPSYYSPRRNPERATNRRNLVISLMADNGFVTEQQAAVYQAKGLDLSEGSLLKHKQYPAFIDLVQRQLKSHYSVEDLQSEGLRIFTSFDPILQEKAEQSISDTIKALRTQAAPKLQSGMLVISPQTSEVLAMVGSADSQSIGFNRVLDTKRSVGSLLKPAIYLSAFENQNYTWASLISDELIYVNKQGKVYSQTEAEELKQTNKAAYDELWSPRNFDNKVHGEIEGLEGQVPLIEAMSKSYNQSTVRLGMEVGVSQVIKTLQALGVRQEINPYPSLFLGAIELSPFEVTQMYQTIANGGFNTPIKAIRSVQSPAGEMLNSYPFDVEQVISNDSAYLIHSGLQEVVRSGTSRSLNRYLSEDLALAGKTGTSNDQRDSWFVGYSGNVLATVWIGNDDNSETPYTGASGALKIWTHFAINSSLQVGRTHSSPNVEWQWIDSQNQLLSRSSCESAVYVAVHKDLVPSEKSKCREEFNFKDISEPIQKKAKGFLQKLFNR